MPFHRRQQMAHDQLDIRVFLGNAQKAQRLMAVHGQVAHVQRHRAVMAVDHPIQWRHDRAGQVERLVAAHQAAAAADLPLGRAEAAVEKALHRLQRVGHVRPMDFSSGARSGSGMAFFRRKRRVCMHSARAYRSIEARID